MKGVIFLALILSFSLIIKAMAQENGTVPETDKVEVQEDLGQIVDEIAEEVSFPLVTSINSKVAGLCGIGSESDIIEIILDLFTMVCVDCLGAL